MITSARLVKKISLKDTLKGMNVGETVFISMKVISTGAIKVAATRAKKEKWGRFYVSADGVNGRTQITRLK